MGYAQKLDHQGFGLDSCLLCVLPHQPAGVIEENSIECYTPPPFQKSPNLFRAFLCPSAAALCGVPLFDQEQRQLATHLALHREKMALLPKGVRTRAKGV